MLTRVGNEQMGRYVRRTLADNGVDVRGPRFDPENLTPYVLFAVRAIDDFPRIFAYGDAADLAVEEGGEMFIASEEVTEVCRSVLPDCDLVVGTEEVRIAGGSTDTHEALRSIRETKLPLRARRRSASWGVGTKPFRGSQCASTIWLRIVYLPV